MIDKLLESKFRCKMCIFVIVHLTCLILVYIRLVALKYIHLLMRALDVARGRVNRPVNITYWSVPNALFEPWHNSLKVQQQYSNLHNNKNIRCKNRTVKILEPHDVHRVD